MTPEVGVAVLGAVATAAVTLAMWGFATGRFSGGMALSVKQIERDVEAYKIETARRFDELRATVKECASKESVDQRFAERRHELDVLRLDVNFLMGGRRGMNRRDQDQ